MAVPGQGKNFGQRPGAIPRRRHLNSSSRGRAAVAPPVPGAPADSAPSCSAASAAEGRGKGSAGAVPPIEAIRRWTVVRRRDLTPSRTGDRTRLAPAGTRRTLHRHAVAFVRRRGSSLRGSRRYPQRGNGRCLTVPHLIELSRGGLREREDCRVGIRENHPATRPRRMSDDQCGYRELLQFMLLYQELP